ncbi:MAG: glycosyltransferase [Lachnospiraceae bacterium]|nr:glycosyltransferase [Lachnospiraceae bacterium]
MKLLSVAIPSYNSQDYMRKAIECLLVGGEEVEILIINDGSKDDTGKIADEYEAKYPGMVRAIHQENKGHGGAVNTGIENATGMYFKVLDSDDWLKEDTFKEVLSRLKDIVGGDRVLDLMICNFVYEKEGKEHKKVMTYKSALPIDEMFTWNDVKHFKKGQYLLMHSVIYRTKLLKECGMVLPEHTFYVDNIFVFEPLPFVKTMYYMNVNLYRYYIGREGQSVNEDIMIKRIDQQIKVNKIMIDYMAGTKRALHPKLERYMLNYLDIMMTISSIFLIKDGSPEALGKKKELWEYLKEHDSRDYFRLRFGMLGNATNIPGKGGRKISVLEYKIAQRFVGFN